MLYTWVTLTEPVPAPIQDQVKRGFAAGVTPTFCRPFAERVKMHQDYLAGQLAEPEADKEKKPTRIFWRNFLIEDGGSAGAGGWPFKYTSPCGTYTGVSSSLKACRKTVDKIVATLGQTA